MCSSDLNFISDISALSSDDASSVLSTTVFLDKRTAPSNWQPPTATSELPSAPAIVQLNSKSFDEISISAISPRSGFIYIADAFTRDWVATVNGEAKPVLLANGHFKAVEVEARKSEINLKYHPFLLRWSLGLYFGAVLLILSAMLFIGMQRGRNTLQIPRAWLELAADARRGLSRRKRGKHGLE